MNILIATGLYPPDIGGTATYALGLAKGLLERGHEVRVVAYGAISDKREATSSEVHIVSKSGGFILRWIRYSRALRKYGKDVDVVIALSSVSVGIPLMFARLKKPKKILRLGGDFFWERYTDAGGMMGLAQWYTSRLGFWRIVNSLFMGLLLRSFHRLVYSTEFQQRIHAKDFSILPRSVVIENAVPSLEAGSEKREARSGSFKILCMSRYVGFKNLFALIDAIALLENVRCTFIGSGPLEQKLRARVAALGLENTVVFQSPVHGEDKMNVFQAHDVLVIPSTTDISPNTALEARAAGMPVLLTRETGLSARLTQGMVLAELVTAQDIVLAIMDIRSRYDSVASDAAKIPLRRGWDEVATEWHTFLTTLV